MRCVVIILSLLLLAPSLSAAPCAAAGDLADATMNPVHPDGTENGDSGHDCCDGGEEPVPENAADDCCESSGACTDCGVAAPGLPSAFPESGDVPGRQTLAFRQPSAPPAASSPPFRPPIA